VRATLAERAAVLPRLRAPLLFGALLLLFVGLVARSVYLQGINKGFLQDQGSSRYGRSIEIPAHRGRITDRNGTPLAISTPVKSIWAFSGQVEAERRELDALAGLLQVDAPTLKRLVDDDSGDYLSIRKQVPPELADRVAALRIKGIYEQPEYKRYYPAGEVAAHVLGFTGDKDVGLEGIELAQQEWLAGKPGSRRVIINRRGEIVEDVASVRAPQEGRDLALAIDSNLQYLAFRELKAAVEENRAKAGGLVVIDVKSGELLAMVNYPTYNPNSHARVAKDRMRNRVLTDTFEPGSTMKPFTLGAALEVGKVRPDTVIQTAPGTLTIGPNTIHDAHRHGALTVEEVLQKSSNVGTAKIALSLAPETMWKMFASSGFGTPPRTGFPGEVSGRLRPHRTWKPIEQATMSYGHGISVNLVQLARGYSVFATDGELKPVTIFRTNPQVTGEPVIRPETARAIRHMLELAVQPGGTAPQARVPGYRVAGKTGTAHKLEKGQYAKKYVSLFVGFAPVTSPRLIVAVMIDEPSAGKYYGGAVAAPVFGAVIAPALRSLGVPYDSPVEAILPSDASEIQEET
jgi:cell division protein FtsI (penicillin-binding protein 3)